MNDQTDQAVEDALRFDALGAAEKLTGLSYKEDKPTEALGMLMHFDHVQSKRQLLESRDDTHYNSSYEDVQRIFNDEGFEKILTRPVEGTEDEVTIWWNPAGVLGFIESYRGASDRPTVNLSKIWYNWMANEGSSIKMVSSGGIYGDNVLVGDHDVREGFRHIMHKFNTKGTFLPQWEKRPFLWLLTYTDSKVEGYDYNAINASVIRALPAHVQRAITPEESNIMFKSLLENDEIPKGTP